MQEIYEKVIEIKDVRKIYRMGNEKIYAVDDVSFEILKGEFCCLLGTSGSGKSTLLNLMAGIEKLSGGEIVIKGKKIHKMSENNLAKFRQRYLGFVFQSYNLMNSMTALENVEFPLIFKRVKTKRRKVLAKDMLSKVGLGSRLNHKPNEMSGGQQQRVGIARAFVSKPEIVFADEPTGNLDTKTAMEVMKLIKGISKENNQTIVMVTHDRRLAEYADKIIHILDGKIQSIEVINDVSIMKENQVIETDTKIDKEKDKEVEIGKDKDKVKDKDKEIDKEIEIEIEIEIDKEIEKGKEKEIAVTDDKSENMVSMGIDFELPRVDVDKLLDLEDITIDGDMIIENDGKERGTQE